VFFARPMHLPSGLSGPKQAGADCGILALPWHGVCRLPWLPADPPCPTTQTKDHS
jgi:hypothetical protein